MSRSRFPSGRGLVAALVVLWVPLRGLAAPAAAPGDDSATLQAQTTTVFWSADPAVNRSLATSTGDQWSPRFASDRTGGAFAAWIQDSRAVRVQHVAWTGALLWSPAGKEAGRGAAVPPAIIADGSGGAFVAWYDTAAVQGRRVDRWGSVWYLTRFGRSTMGTAGTSRAPVMLNDVSNGAFVVYQDRPVVDDPLARTAIWAQRIDQYGYRSWDQDGVRLSTHSSIQTDPAAVLDGDQGLIGFWVDHRFGDPDLLATRLSRWGSVHWQDARVIGLPGRPARPVAVSDGTGGAIVVWEDDRSGETDLYAQRIDSSGRIQWAPEGIPVCRAPGAQNEPVIVPDGEGGAIVAWSDHRTNRTTVYVQRIGPQGDVRWGSEGQPVATPIGEQSRPALSPDQSGGAIVVWQDARGDIDIYGQRLDRDGRLLWRPEGEALGIAPGVQVGPSCIATEDGNAIVGWQDERGTRSRIMAQHTGYMVHCRLAVAADFSASATAGEKPLAVHFTDLSTGPVTSWQWDFENDGVIDATEPDPTHVYAAPGSYAVRLTVTDGTCPSTRIRSGFVTVTPCTNVAVAFTADTLGASPFTVNFTDQSTGPVTGWQWDFQNDGVIDATAPNPTWTYITPRYYSVALTVTDGQCTNQRVRTDYIHVLPCNAVAADFEADVTGGSNPLTVRFTDRSTGAATSWRWDFDDDGVIDATVPDPVTTYRNPGVYSVALSVSDGACENRRVRAGYIEVAPSYRDTLMLGADSPTTSDSAWVPVVFAGRDSLGAVSVSLHIDTERLRFVRLDAAGRRHAFAGVARDSTIVAQWSDPTGGADPIPAGRETLFVVVLAHLGRFSESSQVTIDRAGTGLADPAGRPLLDLVMTDQAPHGLLSFSDGSWRITGTVGYYLGARRVPRARIVLSPTSRSTATDASGTYAFSSVPVGPYVLRASKDDDLEGIDALDGLKILRYALGLGFEYFTDDQKRAADVNLDGRIDSLDVGLIVRASLGLTALPSGDWTMRPGSIGIDPLIRVEPIGDFTAIRCGDVNGDWVAADQSPSRAERTGTAVRLAFSDAFVAPDTSLELPLYVTGLQSAAALSLRIRQTGAGLALRSLTSEVSGTDLLWNQVGDQIRVEWLDMSGGWSALSIRDGKLLRLGFDVVGAAGDVGALEWEAVSIGDPEGSPVAVETVGARVTIGRPETPFALGPARPNPSVGTTRVSFTLARSGRALLEVFDVNGRRTRTLIDGTLDAGAHAIDFDGRDAGGARLGAGVYVMRLASGGVRQSRKLVLMP